MTAQLEERRNTRAESPTADRAELEERMAASLEAIARELALIRAHLEETDGQGAVSASTGPWLRHPGVG